MPSKNTPPAIDIGCPNCHRSQIKSQTYSELLKRPLNKGSDGRVGLNPTRTLSNAVQISSVPESNLDRCAAEEGWLREHAQTGWSDQEICLEIEQTTPSAPTAEPSVLFLQGAATPPLPRRGSLPLQFIHIFRPR